MLLFARLKQRKTKVFGKKIQKLDKLFWYIRSFTKLFVDCSQLHAIKDLQLDLGRGVKMSINNAASHMVSVVIVC